MGLTIKKIQQSSGRTPANQDLLSGLQFYGIVPIVTADIWKEYSSSLDPTTFIFATQLFSVDDARTAGIIPFTDNTAPRATILVATAGATDDDIVIYATVPIKGRTTSIITLCKYKVLLADSTAALQAVAIAALINGGTYIHGWTATVSVATITLIAPKKYGKSLNTGIVYTIEESGVFVGTITQNTLAGTGSLYAAWEYHIRWFFSRFPQGNLWIGIVDAPVYDYKELLALQSASKNTLRLIGVYNTENTDDTSGYTAEIQKIQERALQIDQTFPFCAVYSCNLVDVDLSDLTNGQLVKFNKVGFEISQDGMAEGNLLFEVNGFSTGNIGQKIATLAKSRVSSSDAQALQDTFNLSDGTENDTPAFGNGELLEGVHVNLQTQLNNFRYIFFKVHTGNVPGTYWSGNYQFCDKTDRYAFMNDNRISDKITRICNKTYIPLLEAELIYNQDGTISDPQVEIFQDAGIDAITAECITGFGTMPLISGAPIVTVDPTQPLQTTDNLDIVVKIGENGIARNITIYKGFTN